MDFQDQAISKAANGHSFLLLGQAGTGKSHTMGQIVEVLRQKGKNVLVTASTGIACTPHLAYNCMTVHRTFGLLDGRYSSDQLRNKFCIREEGNAMSFDLIKNADTLILDEISMVSARTLHQIDVVCRTIKKKEQPLGGMQSIFVGDFYQLPPVPSKSTGDAGHYAFTHPKFHQMVPHVIVLTEVRRQDDPALIKCVNELSKGVLSDETHQFIRSHDSDFPPDLSTLKKVLFATNDQADIYNLEMLEAIPKRHKTYEAIDVGDVSLAAGGVQKKLHLKVGAPVMLLKNLSSTLANGRTGTVESLGTREVKVHFPSVKQTAQLNPVSFPRYDHSKGKEIGCRTQIPLKLAFGSTIHKAQGLQFDYVEVECRNLFAPGQLGVAIGRAKTSAGMRIRHFNPHQHVIQPAHAVVAFMDTIESLVFNDDLSCCITAPCEDVIDMPPIDSAESDTEDAREDELVDILTSLLVEGNLHSPSSSSEQSHSSSLDWDDGEPQSGNFVAEADISHKEPSVSFSSDTLAKADIIPNKEVMLTLINTIGLKLDTIFSSIKNVTTAQGLRQFYALWHRYVSDELQTFASWLCGADNMEKVINIANAVRLNFLAEKAKDHNEEQETEEIKEVSEDTYGVIRYLAGRCVMQCKRSHVNYVKNNIGKGKIKVDSAKKKIEMLSVMATSKDNAESGPYGFSSLETTRRQNINFGLTYVTEEVFLFYLELEQRRQFVHTIKRTKKFGTNILAESFHTLLHNDVIRKKFDAIFQDHMFESSLQQELYYEMVENFIRIANQEFKKEIKRALQVKQKFAHRIEIVTTKNTKGGQKGTSKINPKVPSTSGRKEEKAAEAAHSEPTATPEQGGKKGCGRGSKKTKEAEAGSSRGRGRRPGRGSKKTKEPEAGSSRGRGRRPGRGSKQMLEAAASVSSESVSSRRGRGKKRTKAETSLSACKRGKKT